jgi:hypothetical protein
MTPYLLMVLNIRGCAWGVHSASLWVGLWDTVTSSMKCDLKEILIKAYFFLTYDISDVTCTHVYKEIVHSTKCPTNDKSMLHKLGL